jgi:amino acid transporter
MPEQQSPFSIGGAPLKRHLEKTKGVALAIALAALVIMRTDVGYLNLTYGTLAATTFGMVIFTNLANFPLVTWLIGNSIAQGDTSLILFAFVFLMLGLYQRHKRKQEKWDADRPHAHSLGITRFGFLPLREDYIYRFVDPSVVFLLGALLRYKIGFALLGLYWMIAALAIFLVEFSLHQQTELHDWGQGDQKKEAERNGEVLKHMSGQGEAKRGSRATHGIPTGCDELAEEIYKRKREMEANTNMEVKDEPLG